MKSKANKNKTTMPVGSGAWLGISERLTKLKLLKADMRDAVKDINAEIETCEIKIQSLQRAAKQEPIKNRLRLALRLRSTGMTLKAVGVELGVSACRARQIIMKAARWNSINRL